MKVIKRLSLFFLLVFINIFNFAFISKVDTYFTSEYDAKLLSYWHEPTIEEDFKLDRVSVILKKEYSNPNGKIEALDLYEVSSNIISIEDKFVISDELYDEETFRQMLTIYINPTTKEKVLELVKKLNEHEKVLVAHPDYNYKVKYLDVSNDPYFNLQWGLQATPGISINDAWTISNRYNNSTIKVGLFEDGVDMDHPDLIGRVFNGNKISNPYDLEHGTHVAGIIGAITNNNKGISGIANVNIYLLDANNFEASISYAIDNNIKVINASFYYIDSITRKPAPFNPCHYNALERYKIHGILICAAGNSNSNNDNNPIYPACYDLPNVVCVGSINSNGARSSFSNYGQNSVHLFAPGEFILSTFSDYYSYSYSYMSGTSMANHM